MAYVVVWNGTEHLTDASYCPTLEDAKSCVQQELDDYGPELAASLQIFEVGRPVQMTVDSKVTIESYTSRNGTEELERKNAELERVLERLQVGLTQGGSPAGAGDNEE